MTAPQPAAGFILGNAPWLAAGALMTFLSSFGQTFFISVFAGEIRSGFGLSHGAWGGIYALGTLAAAATMIWSGQLTDRFRVRTLGPLVLAGLAAASLAMAANRSVFLLPLIVFALRIFGQGMCTHTAAVAMARWFVGHRGRALAIASLGYSLGEALLPLIFVAAMAFLDWQWLWVAAAAICLAGIPALAGLLRRERSPQSLAQSHSGTGMQNRQWTRAQALRHPLFWMMLPALLGPGAFVTALFFQQVVLAEIKGWPHIQLVALFPLFTAVSILSMILSGWLLDKFGTAPLMPFYQAPMVVAFAIFALGQSPAAAAAGFVFLGFSVGANTTLPSAFLAEFYGTAHLGAIKALAMAVMVFGSALGPALTGGLIDLGVGLESQFLGIAAFFAMVCVLTRAAIARERARP